MRVEIVQFFTEREEEFVNLLIGIGIKKNVAKLLVFLSGTPEATSRAIEHGTDLRQPEVSMAMKYLEERGWIKSCDRRPGNKGRPQKAYSLAVPVNKILAAIEKSKEAEAKSKLALVKKLRDYL